MVISLNHPIFSALFGGGMDYFHPFLHPIYFEMIDINHIIIFGAMRTFNRRIEVDFTKKSAKLNQHRRSNE